MRKKDRYLGKSTNKLSKNKWFLLTLKVWLGSLTMNSEETTGGQSDPRDASIPNTRQ